MSRLTYTKAINDVLSPVGFRRRGPEWTRIRGEVEEMLDLQKSRVDGAVTVNVWAKNLETERILKLVPCEEPLGIIQQGVRIGELVDGQDWWWKNDPDGPAEMARLVCTHALPWFDQFPTLEAQATKQYGRGRLRPWRSSSIAPLAITLYRMGQIDEALALFDAPIPRTALPGLVATCKCVKRWLEAQKGTAPPDAAAR